MNKNKLETRLDIKESEMKQENLLKLIQTCSFITVFLVFNIH